MPAKFSIADGSLEVFFADIAFFRNGGAPIMTAGEWLICGDKAFDLSSGDMICPAMGNLERGQEHALEHPDFLEPNTFRAIVQLPDGLAIATGREVRFTGRDYFRAATWDRLPFDAPVWDPRKRGLLKEVAVTGSVPAASEGALIAAGRIVYAGGSDVVTAVDSVSKKVIWSAPVAGIPFSVS